MRCWGAISQADDKALQSPFRSGIEIDDYQLDPVVRALTMPRVNLLIADDVGLGKPSKRVWWCRRCCCGIGRAISRLIVCPSSLQPVAGGNARQVRPGVSHHRQRSLEPLAAAARDLINPWRHFPRLITSIDFLKRERPLRRFRELLPAHGETVYPRPYDLLIVDEAHNIAPSGRGWLRHGFAAHRGHSHLGPAF